jgi:HD domain
VAGSVATETDRVHVRLAELVAALSLGIHLGFGQPMEHVLRQCLIALRLAEAIGLDGERRADVYYTALLVNVGCHSDAREQAEWFGDDIACKSIKYDYEPHSIRMAASGLRQLGAGLGPVHRFRLGLEFAISGHREVDKMIEHHVAIARTMGEHLQLAPSVLDALGAAYERWDGRGWPGALEGEVVPLASRVAQVAEYAEVANRLGGVAAVRDLARERRGRQFDPHLCDVLDAEADVILSGLDEIGTWDAVIAAEPTLAVMLSGERLDEALLALANFIDIKSPYFLGHSRAVADLSAEAARRLDMSESDRRALYRTSLVHDWGRLGISNAIWARRGRSARASGSASGCFPTSPIGCFGSRSRSRRLPRSPCSTANGSMGRATQPACRGQGSRDRPASSRPPTPTRRCASRGRTATHASRPTRRPSCARTCARAGWTATPPKPC